MAMIDHLKTAARGISVVLAVAGFSFGMGSKGDNAVTSARVDAQNKRIDDFKTEIKTTVEKVEASAAKTAENAAKTADEAEKTRRSVERIERGGVIGARGQQR